MRAYHLLMEYDRSKTADLLADKIRQKLDPAHLSVMESEQFYTRRAQRCLADWSAILSLRDPKLFDEMHELVGERRWERGEEIEALLKPFWRSDDLVDEVLKAAEDADPTRNNKFVPTILRWFLSDELMIEDFYKCTELFETYVKYKNRLNDVDLRTVGYKDFEDRMFHETKKKSQAELAKSEEEAFYESGGAKLVKNTADYKIIIPKTKEAAIFFGKNTRWCTSAEKNNMFEQYNRRGSLYIVLFKADNVRWQFHFEDQMFMDERDHELKPEQVKESSISAWFDATCRKYMRDADLKRGGFNSNLIEWLTNPTEEDYVIVGTCRPASLLDRSNTGLIDGLVDRSFADDVIRKVATASVPKLDRLADASRMILVKLLRCMKNPTTDDLVLLVLCADGQFSSATTYIATQYSAFEYLVAGANENTQMKVFHAAPSLVGIFPRPCMALCQALLKAEGSYTCACRLKAVPAAFKQQLLDEPPHFDKYEAEYQRRQIEQMRTY